MVPQRHTRVVSPPSAQRETSGDLAVADISGFGAQKLSDHWVSLEAWKHLKRPQNSRIGQMRRSSPGSDRFLFGPAHPRDLRR